MDDCYRGIFILTFTWWVVHQADPWTIKDEDAIEAMQIIWDGVYGSKIKHKITVGDSVFKNVCF